MKQRLLKWIEENKWVEENQRLLWWIGAPGIAIMVGLLVLGVALKDGTTKDVSAELLLSLGWQAAGVLVTVFIINQLLAWDREQRLIPAKNRYYANALGVVDGLLKELLPVWLRMDKSVLMLEHKAEKAHEEYSQLEKEGKTEEASKKLSEEYEYEEELRQHRVQLGQLREQQPFSMEPKSTPVTSADSEREFVPLYKIDFGQTIYFGEAYKTSKLRILRGFDHEPDSDLDLYDWGGGYWTKRTLDSREDLIEALEKHHERVKHLQLASSGILVEELDFSRGLGELDNALYEAIDRLQKALASAKEQFGTTEQEMWEKKKDSAKWELILSPERGLSEEEKRDLFRKEEVEPEVTAKFDDRAYTKYSVQQVLRKAKKLKEALERESKDALKNEKNAET